MDRQLSYVLLIDDEDTSTESLKRILERRGYAVLTAKDGLEGMELLKENNVNIIFCDIVMPRMDGIEFLSEIRKHNFKAEVIILTGYSSVEHCVESIEKNALQYLIKPVSIEDILESIHMAEERIAHKKLMLRAAVVKSNRGLKSIYYSPPKL